MRAPEARAKFLLFFARKPNIDDFCDEKMGATVAPISKKMGAIGPVAPAYFHRWLSAAICMSCVVLAELHNGANDSSVPESAHPPPQITFDASGFKLV